MAQNVATFLGMEDIASSIPVVEIRFGDWVAGDIFDFLVGQSLEQHKATANGPRICVLDFRDTRWIEISSTQRITAFFLAAKKRNWMTIVRPPRLKKVRDHWRLWRFPEAFEAATKTPFGRLISGDDRVILNEKQSTFDERRILKIHDGRHPNSPRSSNFWGFVSENISPTNLSSVASGQADLWSLDDVQDLLGKYIEGRVDYIPTRVVFEAIFNSTKHPGANIIQTASYHDYFSHLLNGEDLNKRSSDFVLFFWDNGRSILSTVDDALERNIDVKRHYIKDFERNYIVKYNPWDKTKKNKSTVNSSISLHSDLTDEIRLLSVLFPGVSTKPELDSNHITHPSLGEFDERFTRRGMGLFVLANAVSEVLGGTLEFRTGRHYMHVKKTAPRTEKQSGAPLEIQISDTNPHLPEFEGNMVSVRIPVS